MNAEFVWPAPQIQNAEFPPNHTVENRVSVRKRLRISVPVSSLSVVTNAPIFRKLLAIKMGRPTGLEPATPRFTILCSNQLSYDRRKGRKNSGASRQLSIPTYRRPA